MYVACHAIRYSDVDDDGNKNKVDNNFTWWMHKFLECVRTSTRRLGNGYINL